MHYLTRVMSNFLTWHIMKQIKRKEKGKRCSHPILVKGEIKKN